MSFCINCGNGLAPDDMFCKYCGNPVVKNNSTEYVSQNPQQPVQQSYQKPPQQPQYYQQQPVKKKSVISVILIIFLFLFILGGVGSYFAYRYFVKKATDTVDNLNSKIEKEITKEIPKEYQLPNSEQKNTETEPIVEKETIKEKEIKRENFEPTDVSDVNRDSESNSDKYPGKYPEGSNMYLNTNDLSGYSKQELKIMRNEIFARHGYIFQTDDMKLYFRNQSWYKPQRENVDNFLSSIEKKNIATIKSVENRK